MYKTPSDDSSTYVPRGARLRVFGWLMGWGGGLGALTGAITGALLVVGHWTWPLNHIGIGLLVGLVLGSGLGLLTGLICTVALIVLLPAVLSGHRKPHLIAVEAATIAVLLLFALFSCAVTLFTPGAWPQVLLPPFLLALAVLGSIAFAACVSVATLAVRSVVRYRFTLRRVPARGYKGAAP